MALSDITMLRDLLKEGRTYKLASGDPFVVYNNIENCLKNKQNIKQIDVRFSCVCPHIDHEFLNNIVKVAVDPGGNSRVDHQTTWTIFDEILCQ